MRTLKNREAIVEELAEMLKKFDMQLNAYQTDVYLYYDEEKQTAELDTFINVGGRSWLNDDHPPCLPRCWPKQFWHALSNSFRRLRLLADICRSDGWLLRRKDH